LQALIHKASREFRNFRERRFSQWGSNAGWPVEATLTYKRHY